MSIMGEAPVGPQDGAAMQCNRCRRMCAVDCGTVSVSNGLLAGDATQSKAAQVRRRTAARNAATANGSVHNATTTAGSGGGGGLPSFIGGPFGQFQSIQPTPWGSAQQQQLLQRRGGGGQASVGGGDGGTLALSAMPSALTAQVHLSSLLGDRVAASPLVRIDRERLVDDDPTDATTPPLPLLSPSSVAARSLATNKPTGLHLTPPPPTNRHRGTTTTATAGGPSSVTSADATRYGPYLHRPLLLHAVWDLLQVVGDEALINTPLCLPCWKEVLVELQGDVEREQSVLLASDAYLTPTSSNLAMCATTATAAADQEAADHAASALSYDHLLLEEGRQAVANLCALDDTMHTLLAELADVATAEGALAREEDALRGCTNAVHVNQWYTVDCKEMLLTECMQVDAELNFLSEQCMLREVYVVELPAGVASWGAINGLRIGKVQPSSGIGAEATAGERNKAHAFLLPSGLREYAMRELARMTNGDAYFPVHPVLATSQAGVAIGAGEINGACGYLAAVLKTLTQRNHLTLKSCTVHPQGCESTIEVPVPNKKPPRSDVLSFYVVEKFFAWKTFGQAWVAFALGLKEVIEFLQQAIMRRLDMQHREQPLSLFAPYTIDKDGLVGGHSVKHGSVSDDVWGRGVRCALANVDWCLAAQTVLEAMQRDALAAATAATTAAAASSHSGTSPTNADTAAVVA